MGKNRACFLFGQDSSLRLQAGATGDCIDCGICVEVCDQVMDKIGAPHGLIRFAVAAALDDPAVRVGERSSFALR